MFFRELSSCSSALTLRFARTSCMTLQKAVIPSVSLPLQCNRRWRVPACHSLSVHLTQVYQHSETYSPFQHFLAAQGTDSRAHQLPSPRSRGERSETPCKEISRCLFPCPIIHPHYASAWAPWLQTQCPQPVVRTAAFASPLPLDHAFSWASPWRPSTGSIYPNTHPSWSNNIISAYSK